MKSNGIITPAFVFDIDALFARIADIRKKFGSRFRLCYAVKANPFLTGECAALCDFLEVCSPGEYEICERVSAPPEKIVLSGVYKEKCDTERVVSRCGNKATYTVESLAQWELLTATAEKFGVVLPVIIRLSSGNQFGSDKPTAERMIAAKNPALDIVGIQLYSGTQKKLAKMQKEIAALSAWLDELRENYDFSCRRIEYGPGLPVAYFENESVDETETINGLRSAFASVPSETEIVIEAGRFVAAGCGKYVTTVVDVKRTDGVNYAITDGGINHLNYYGQLLAMKIPHMSVDSVETERDEPEPWTVCGALCTVADVLVRGCKMRKPNIGDRITFHNVGAYSVTEGLYLFLSRDMPRIYKVRGDKSELVRDVVKTCELNS